MGSVRRLGPVTLALCVVVSVVVAGLAGASSGPGLPELPGVEERVEGLYDDDGCLRTGENERDCTVTAEAVDDALAGHSEDDVRHLAGFTGSHWTDQPAAGAPVVLEHTVAVTADAAVEVRGLVRNEGLETVDAIEVTATLRGPAGEELAVLSGPALVGPVRSGEPVPFVLGGPPVAGPVESVGWSARAAAGAVATRELEWQAYWEQPAGNRDPVENYLYAETGAGPHPHVVFGSVHNVGGGPTADVRVVTAWLGDDGRLAVTTQASAVDPSGQPVGVLDVGAAADALVVAEGVPVGAEALVWVSGS